MRRTNSFIVCRFVLALLLACGLTTCFADTSWRQSKGLQAQASEDSEAEHVRASLIADCKALAPGKKFRLGVELKMDPGWHTYYRESGEAGMPTKIIWELPAGFKASEPVWEIPHKIVDAGITTYGYNDSTLIASEIEVPADLKVQDRLNFKAKVKWLVCKDACIPGSADVELSLPVVRDAAAAPDNQDRFQKVNFNGPVTDIKEDGGLAGSTPKKPEAQPPQTDIFVYLGFAFIGGFILNLMPCVLPVISIKVFSLIQQAGEDAKQVFRHGITFALGIITSFLMLAALVIVIQSAGQKIGWGFQFQYPVFVLVMASIVTLFALSMFGVFYFDIIAGRKEIDELAGREGLPGTFFKGVLATVLSTPCTAPFLGAALGFAFAQPWWTVLAIFFVIALGMSFPYFVLAMRPDWMKYLPKPGPWMEKFKESMGFLLLATVVWLVSVLNGLVEPDAITAAISFLFCLSVACWIQGSFVSLNSTVTRKVTAWGISLAVLCGGYWFFLQPYPELLGTRATMGSQISRNAASGIQWQNFSLAELDHGLKANKTVFIDFTARWCLTCKANEATIINTPPVIEKFKALNVLPLKADWTAQNPEIAGELRKFGRSGVPLYVIFPAGHPEAPVILPEALTQQIVLESLDRAGPSH